MRLSRPPGRAGHVASDLALAADPETLNQGLVPLRRPALQIVQQTTPSSNHREQSPAGMMVFLVRLEVLCELENPLAEDRYLDLWRTAVSLVLLVLLDYLRFQISRQCHSRIGTPRLYLNPVYVPIQNNTGSELVAGHRGDVLALRPR